jgi:phage-related baseplate assembly protein
LLENGEYPDEEMIKTIHQTLDGNVPMDDFVIVGAPYTRDFDIDLVYYIPRERQNSTQAVQRNVENAIEQYKTWQTGRMGRDINPDRLTELMRIAGAKRAEITAPTFTVIKENEVAALVKFNAIFGGVEDE